jgi:phosphate transport system substrate-binding protein
MSAAQARGVNMKPIIVAYDGIGVVINAGNPLTTLTKRQVEQIFAGDITDWSAVGGSPGKISIYTRNTSSGTYSDFKDLAMNRRDYASSSQKMAGNEQIVAEVGRNPNGIGYCGLAYINDPTVKAVSIGGALPSKESVLRKQYPYARPTFYYTNGDPVGEAAKFVEFTLSDEGQAIVGKVGFVPIR